MAYGFFREPLSGGSNIVIGDLGTLYMLARVESAASRHRTGIFLGHIATPTLCLHINSCALCDWLWWIVLPARLDKAWPLCFSQITVVRGELLRQSSRFSSCLSCASVVDWLN